VKRKSNENAINGHDLWKEEVPARKGLAYMPEHPDLIPYASIKEILSLIKNHAQSGATVVVVSNMIEPFIDLASVAVTVQSGKVFRFRDLPDLYKKKLAFLEQFAEGGLPL